MSTTHRTDLRPTSVGRILALVLGLAARRHRDPAGLLLARGDERARRTFPSRSRGRPPRSIRCAAALDENAPGLLDLVEVDSADEARARIEDRDGLRRRSC